MEAFQYKYDINGADSMVVEFNVTAGQTIDGGDIVEFAAGGTVQRAAAGSVRIAGVAVEGIANAAAGKRIQVNVGNGAIFRVKYTAGTKLTLTDTDRGVSFDLAAGVKTINLDDTTGGMCAVVDYDNINKTADVLIKSRLINT